jgi:5'-3' exonuclease
VRLHLVDGTFELFRAHYSKRPDHFAPDGRPLKATVGLVDSMFTLLSDRDEAVTHLAIAFDNPIRSFRNDLFDGYKSDEGMDPILRGQFDEVEIAARAAGITVWSMNRHEADDALATGAARWREDVEQVRILSPDKDLGQCVQGTRVVTVDRIRRTVQDEEALRKRLGFGPASVPDYLALVGDTADGIPGLAGFGERTASRLLARFAHVDQIPASAAEWPVEIRGAATLAATLASHQDEVRLYRTLATLVNDVPLPETLDALRWSGVSAGFHAWCEATGAASLESRAPAARPG